MSQSSDKNILGVWTVYNTMATEGGCGLFCETCPLTPVKNYEEHLVSQSHKNEVAVLRSRLLPTLFRKIMMDTTKAVVSSYLGQYSISALRTQCPSDPLHCQLCGTGSLIVDKYLEHIYSQHHLTRRMSIILPQLGNSYQLDRMPFICEVCDIVLFPYYEVSLDEHAQSARHRAALYLLPQPPALTSATKPQESDGQQAFTTSTKSPTQQTVKTESPLFRKADMDEMRKVMEAYLSEHSMRAQLKQDQSAALNCKICDKHSLKTDVYLEHIRSPSHLMLRASYITSQLSETAKDLYQEKTMPFMCEACDAILSSYYKVDLEVHTRTAMHKAALYWIQQSPVATEGLALEWPPQVTNSPSSSSDRKDGGEHTNTTKKMIRKTRVTEPTTQNIMPDVSSERYRFLREVIMEWSPTEASTFTCKLCHPRFRPNSLDIYQMHVLSPSHIKKLWWMLERSGDETHQRLVGIWNNQGDKPFICEVSFQLITSITFGLSPF